MLAFIATRIAGCQSSALPTELLGHFSNNDNNCNCKRQHTRAGRRLSNWLHLAVATECVREGSTKGRY